MLTKNEILKYLSKNKEMFKQNFNIIRIGLFGSFARDEQTENSDIDIIIEMETDTQQIFEKRMELKKTVKNYFHKEVDVCHAGAIKSVFKEFILNEVIYV